MADDRTPLVQSTPAHFLHHTASSRVPQTIAHRGFKGNYPENTLIAIDGAIRAGSHAIEIDLHLTRDGVVVLSHDGTLERCFGIKKKIIDCDWSYIQTLRTLKAPHEPMPRLADVLEYLVQPGREQIWAMLDIKLDNDPLAIMKGIAETIESVPIRTVDWHRRINLGCWSARYLPLCQRYLPRYAITLICWNVSYARQFLQVPRIAFSINQKVLIGPLGKGFLEEARAARRRVYVWTVNAPALVRWSIRHEIDGVITDHPDRFREDCKQWEEDLTSDSPSKRDPALDRLSLRQRMEILLVALYVVLFGWYYRKNFPAVERVQFEERKLE
ncbi:hypothetical protein N7474_009207 [Penicillium riverlandense]|uniref:uncharacterized protein n=1 Tax=Penicillium riverlandense TaxID=1903569 RepID=UPI002548A4E0|nr:uncharacterized protein N7474_009207 [Penicillium riverlandense]KAJ5807938.1 hypothetical protein N7474_009207 [Penicillium riverlandense]